MEVYLPIADVSINLSVNRSVTCSLFSIILAVGLEILLSVSRISLASYRRKTLLKVPK